MSNSLIIKRSFSQTQNKVSTSIQSFNATLVQNSGRLSFAFTLNNEITYRYPECTTTWILKNGLSQQEIMIISTATHEKCTTKLVDFNPASTKNGTAQNIIKMFWVFKKKKPESIEYIHLVAKFCICLRTYMWLNFLYSYAQNCA